MFMRKSFFLFIVVFAFAGIETDVYANQRVALVIGNSAYQHTARLDNSKNDAMDMAAVLKQLGFQVIDGFDLDKVAFERKLRDFSLALRAAEVGLFFYAGHGMQVAGQNYLLPVDAKAETADALDWEMVRLYFNPATSAPTPTPQPPAPPPPSPPLPTVLFPSRSVWTHNGSVMSVTMANNKIRILYEEPRAGMVAEGVRRGTLLFEGEAFGERLLGTAFVFDRRCSGGIPYQVSGDALQGRQRIVITGQAPSQLDSCQPVQYRPDTLVFD